MYELRIKDIYKLGSRKINEFALTKQIYDKTYHKKTSKSKPMVQHRVVVTSKP